MVARFPDQTTPSGLAATTRAARTRNDAVSATPANEIEFSMVVAEALAQRLFNLVHCRKAKAEVQQTHRAVVVVEWTNGTPDTVTVLPPREGRMLIWFPRGEGDKQYAGDARRCTALTLPVPTQVALRLGGCPSIVDVTPVVLEIARGLTRARKASCLDIRTLPV